MSEDKYETRARGVVGPAALTVGMPLEQIDMLVSEIAALQRSAADEVAAEEIEIHCATAIVYITARDQLRADLAAERERVERLRRVAKQAHYMLKTRMGYDAEPDVERALDALHPGDLDDEAPRG